MHCDISNGVFATPFSFSPFMFYAILNHMNPIERKIMWVEQASPPAPFMQAGTLALPMYEQAIIIFHRLS
jgi:hypothetical protein